MDSFLTFKVGDSVMVNKLFSSRNGQVGEVKRVPTNNTRTYDPYYLVEFTDGAVRQYLSEALELAGNEKWSDGSDFADVRKSVTLEPNGTPKVSTWEPERVVYPKTTAVVEDELFPGLDKTELSDDDFDLLVEENFPKATVDAFKKEDALLKAFIADDIVREAPLPGQPEGGPAICPVSSEDDEVEGEFNADECFLGGLTKIADACDLFSQGLMDVVQALRATFKEIKQVPNGQDK